MPDQKSESEKIQLEHDAAKLFMRWYERNTGQHIRHLWHNRPSKPDTSTLLEGERLDLEIAHLYGTEEEAMKLLGRELPDTTKLALHLLERSTDPDARLLNALNRILQSKSEKSYKSKRVWLVIRNVHPDWDADRIRQQCAAIDVPNNHPFEQIWIVGDFKGKSGIVKLYPRS